MERDTSTIPITRPSLQTTMNADMSFFVISLALRPAKKRPHYFHWAHGSMCEQYYIMLIRSAILFNRWMTYLASFPSCVGPGNEASTYRTVPPDFSILFLSSNCTKKMTEEENRERRGREEQRGKQWWKMKGIERASKEKKEKSEDEKWRGGEREKISKA